MALPGDWCSARRMPIRNPPTSGDLSAKDFPTDKGSTYDVVVAAIGNDAAFSVNGTAVAMLDISDQPDAGNVSLASGFFSSSSVAGADISFSNVTLYDLNADSTGTPAEASPSPDNGNTDGQTEGRPTATAEGGNETPAAGNETPTPGNETPTAGSAGYKAPTLAIPSPSTTPGPLPIRARRTATTTSVSRTAPARS